MRISYSTRGLCARQSRDAALPPSNRTKSHEVRAMCGPKFCSMHVTREMDQQHTVCLPMPDVEKQNNPNF